MAEDACIGAILLDADAAMPAILPVLSGPEDFYREQNGWAYAGACSLWERGDSITLVTLAHQMDGLSVLDRAGGEPWLVALLGTTYTVIGVEAHARIVARDALYRRLIHAAQVIARLGYNGGPDPEYVLRRVENTLSGAARGFHGTGKEQASLPLPGLRSAFS